MKSLTWRHRFMIVVLALTAYAPVLRLGFIWDDHIIIETNPWIRSWAPANLLHDFVSDNAQGTGDHYYRPLQALSHRIDYTFWRLNPFGFHLTGLLFHIGATLLLAQLILAMGLSPLAAMLCAVMFAVHPIGIEQFLTASGRTTPMSLFFCLASLLFLIRPGTANIALGTLAYALGLLSKENSAILPTLAAILFLYLRKPASWYWRLTPLAILTIAYAFLRHAMVSPPLPFSIPLFIFFLTHVFPKLLFHYAVLLIFPWNLHSHHLIPRLSHLWPLYLAAFFALPLLLARRKERTGLFCFAWFFLNLLPMVPPMITGGFVLDHWGYPMALGVLLPLGNYFAGLWEGRPSPFNRAMSLAFFPLIICWALLVHLNVELRGSDEKIYTWALHFTTSSPIKHNLGIYYLQSGRPAQAIPYLEEVRDRYPDDVVNTYALAKAYWAAGHRQASLRYLRELSKAHPPYPPAARTLQQLDPTTGSSSSKN